MSKNHIKLSALPDPRSESEKSDDLHFHKLYSLVPINWTTKPQSEWKKYTLRDQDGAGSCIANGSAKALEAIDGIVYSAHPTYSRRANAPIEGMYLDDAGNILGRSINGGTTAESIDPSNGLTEIQMDAPVTVPTPKQISSHGFVQIDIDMIAQAIDQHNGLPITFDLSWAEWENNPGVPELIPGSTVDGGHCICAVDYTLWNGKKAIICENSWGEDEYSLNKSSQVVITEDYLKARCTGVMFFIPKDSIITPMNMQNLNLRTWCAAAMVFEGFYPGTPSWLDNNPGNLKYVGQGLALNDLATSGKGAFCIFRTFEDGYTTLYTMLINACNGTSKVYHPTDTLLQFYQKYTSDGSTVSANYASFVARFLGVTVDTPIGNLIK